MPAKKSTEDLDELLSLGTPSEPTPVEEEPVEEESAESFDELLSTPEEEAPAPNLSSVQDDDMDDEIARLKAELAKPLPTPVDERPKPEAELTPKERELRDLKDAMARRNALVAEAAGPSYDDSTGAETILIHILEDGFTINGEVCYRGREIEFVVGGKAYEQTKDRYGKTWLDMTDEDQYRRYGAMKFGRGPWPFRQLDQLTLADLPEGATTADLEAVKKAAARRDRRAPVFSR